VRSAIQQSSGRSVRKVVTVGTAQVRPPVQSERYSRIPRQASLRGWPACPSHRTAILEAAAIATAALAAHPSCGLCSRRNRHQRSHPAHNLETDLKRDRLIP